jgi:3-hydroxyacyl-CoA dehydrogenase/enoyl-CoA hydratase/3-hydroxybutyryl-CoA epimerase
VAPEEALRLEPGEGGIARLVFGRPGSPVNLLSPSLLEHLDTLLAEVERLAAAGEARALLVRSARPGSFIAGMDLREVQEATDPAAATATARRGQRVFRRLEELPLPTLTALDGVCLGAGAELALACGYRLASDTPQTRIGFPEVQLGILPALGGTVRLPRLVGVRTALDLILTGRRVQAREAHRLGLVDAVFPPADFEEAVLRFARERAERGRLRAAARRGVGRRLLEDTAPGRRLLFARTARALGPVGPGRSAAAHRALETVADGLALPLERAFEREAEALGELIVSREAKALLHDFRLRRAARSHAPAPGIEPPAVERVAVLGAGRMGAGVAHLLATHGVPVRVRELQHGALVNGLRYAQALFRAEAERGTLSRREMEERTVLVSATLGFGGFGTVDLVLEAAGEDPETRRRALGEVEEHVREECILASTGAAVTIVRLQEAVEHPARVVGMHFFHPVGRVPLVEVVHAERTSERAVAAVEALARRVGKVPLVVRDGPGFLVNRVLFPLLHEAFRLLEEGAAVERVDGAMVEFGMRTGPLRTLDELGLEWVARVSRLLEEGLGARFRPPPALDAVLRAGLRGREWGGGLYHYEKGKPARPNREARDALREAARPREEGPLAEEMRSRMILAMVNEAARALEEGIVRTAAEVDLGVTLAAGFPPFRGGLLYHADRLGIPEVVGTLEELAERFGPRFSPAPLLHRLAGEGGTLYDVRGGGASGQRPGEVLQ